jgi:hypothetical protein
MPKPDGYSSIGPILIQKHIKDEMLNICAIELDAKGKKKPMETKIIELLVAEIKRHKPGFELPGANGGEPIT